MQQEIHLVSGKGGVGKSVSAAAIALHLSKKKQNVLLVELGDQSFYKDFFGLAGVGFSPVKLKDNIDVALWAGETCLYEYAVYLLKIEKFAKLFFSNKIMSTFLSVAPALHELAILGKITSTVRHHGPEVTYDAIVVDAYATGHFEALLNAPVGMAEAIQFGPMGEQSRGITNTLKNPDYANYYIVTLPEDLPIKESLELSDYLTTSIEIKPKFILNKMISIIPDIKNNIKNADESDIFIKYLTSHIENEKNSIKTLRDSGIESNQITQIPFVISHDPWKIVSEIEKFL